MCVLIDFYDFLCRYIYIYIYILYIYICICIFARHVQVMELTCPWVDESHIRVLQGASHVDELYDESQLLGFVDEVGRVGLCLVPDVKLMKMD